MKYIILLFITTTLLSCKNNNEEDDITYLVTRKQELLDSNSKLLNQRNSLFLEKKQLEEDIDKLHKYMDNNGMFVDI